MVTTRLPTIANKDDVDVKNKNGDVKGINNAAGGKALNGDVTSDVKTFNNADAKNGDVNGLVKGENTNGDVNALVKGGDNNNGDVKGYNSAKNDNDFFFTFNIGSDTKVGVDSDQGRDSRLKGGNNILEGSGKDANIEGKPEGKPEDKPEGKPETSGDDKAGPEAPPNVPTIPLGRPGFSRPGAPLEPEAEAKEGMRFSGNNPTDIEDEADAAKDSKYPGFVGAEKPETDGAELEQTDDVAPQGAPDRRPAFFPGGPGGPGGAGGQGFGGAGGSAGQDGNIFFGEGIDGTLTQDPDDDPFQAGDNNRLDGTSGAFVSDASAGLDASSEATPGKAGAMVSGGADSKTNVAGPPGFPGGFRGKSDTFGNFDGGATIKIDGALLGVDAAGVHPVSANGATPVSPALDPEASLVLPNNLAAFPIKDVPLFALHGCHIVDASWVLGEKEIKEIF